MLSRDTLQKQLAFTIAEIDVPGLGDKIQGKVRDSYVLGDRRVLVTSDRLSAFDVILTTVPFKGEVLNRMAAYWFNATKDIVENHIIDVPHPNIFVARQVEILPVEVIVRGYLTGSAWRDYSAGKDVSGVALPQGMKKSQRFDTPLLTPSTKAERGEHDMPISCAEIVSSGLVEKSLWSEVERVAQELFAFGSKEAASRGLILVDTKYEFGLDEAGELMLIDEIHTPDSSRFWIKKTYSQRFKKGLEPENFDKEFMRLWFKEHGYTGEGNPPEMNKKIIKEIKKRYKDVYEKITGEKFSYSRKKITL